jgi:hypothetical protein
MFVQCQCSTEGFGALVERLAASAVTMEVNETRNKPPAECVDNSCRGLPCIPSPRRCNAAPTNRTHRSLTNSPRTPLCRVNDG